MKMDAFPFATIDWAEVERTEHRGETGHAYWQTRYFGEGDRRIRVRMVEYSPGYLADHWCQKGHVILCLAGELDTALADGRVFVLRPGMTYQVGDEAEAHQSRTASGAKLFIVD